MLNLPEGERLDARRHQVILAKALDGIWPIGHACAVLCWGTRRPQPPAVGKLWISRKNILLARLVPFQTNFPMGGKSTQIPEMLPIFLGGPLLLSTLGGQIGGHLAHHMRHLDETSKLC